MRTWVKTVNSNALEVLGANNLASVETLVSDTLVLATRVKREGIVELVGKAKEEGMTPLDVLLPEIPGVSQDPNTVTVVMDQLRFFGRTVTVQPGTTVVWVNSEAPKHTATSDDGLFKSGSMSQGDTYSFTFTEVGEYPYYCRFHGDARPSR